jgi:tRNA (guanine-N7-)-methyltransferase
MAQLYPDTNFLGIEIRQPLVIAANREKEQLGLTNLHYIFGSMNYSASHLLASLPVNLLKYITVQFPDPWFKRKHQKRRVIQPELVNVLVNYLIDDGIVFLQSDIQEVALEMKNRFAQNSLLVRQHSEAWLDKNPFPVATERELYVLKDNLPVYRSLFKKEK